MQYLENVVFVVCHLSQKGYYPALLTLLEILSVFAVMGMVAQLVMEQKEVNIILNLINPLYQVRNTINQYLKTSRNF